MSQLLQDQLAILARQPCPIAIARVRYRGARQGMPGALFAGPVGRMVIRALWERGMTWRMIAERNGTAPRVEARNLVIWIIRNFTQRSFTQIADLLSRDKASASRSARVFTAAMDRGDVVLSAKLQLQIEMAEHAKRGPTMMQRGVWTDERVERLRVLFFDGASASMIAGELGNGITRNAVIGKLYRAGLSRGVMSEDAMEARAKVERHRRSRLTAERDKKRLAARARSSDAAHAPKERIEPWRPARPLPTVEIVERAARSKYAPAPGHQVDFFGLINKTCRFPIGESNDFDSLRFCGSPEADMAAGRPYCPACARIAYLPPKPKKAA